MENDLTNSNTRKIKKGAKAAGFFKRNAALLVCLVLVTTFYLIMYKKTGGGDRLMSHTGFDSYSLQTVQWLEGRNYLKDGQNYPWLELAIFEEYYYISFPPLPSAMLLPWVLIFGEKTPSGLIMTIYSVLTFLFLWLMCRRMKLPELMCAVGALFALFGSSMLFVSMSGGVWFQAQIVAMMFTALAFFHVAGDSEYDKIASLFTLALAVGARPFNAIYYPILVYMILKKTLKEYGLRPKTVLRLCSYCILPCVVAASYMFYNYSRFGKILEFGHNYLPEFTRQEANQYGQFSFNYVSRNLKDMFTSFPTVTEKGISYGQFGFAIFVANPLFVVLAVAVCISLVKSLLKLAETDLSKRQDEKGVEIAILFMTILLHIFLFAMHKTLGAYQFGSRYTADAMVGTLFCICLCNNVFKKSNVPVFAILSFAMALNIMGAVQMSPI